jgi:hypothetical protein
VATIKRRPCLLVTRHFHRLRSQVSLVESPGANKRNRPVTVVTSRVDETIACGVVTAEICLVPFEGEIALQSRREVLSLAGRELQSQKTSGEARI